MSEKPLFVAVGIDSGDVAHVIYASGPGSEPQWQDRIGNSVAEYQRLLDELATRWPDLPVRFALEDPESLLARFLLHSGCCVYAPNPLTVQRTREGLAPSGKKDDPLDARAMVKVLRDQASPEARQPLTPLLADSEETTLLAGLVSQRRQLVTEKVRLQLSLRTQLKRFYPRALELFPRLDQSLTLTFLDEFPSPKALEKASETQWAEFFAGRRYPRPGQIPLLWEKAQGPQIPLRPAEDQLAAGQVRRLVRLLTVVLEELADLEKQIETAFETHPDAAFFRSAPGAARVLAPALLSLFGDRRERWRDWRHLAAQSGTAPVTKESGKKRQVRMRRQCDPESRSVLFLFANASRLQCGWAQACYHQQRAAGKTHAAALRTLGNKWLRILFRLWQDRVEYDESRYLAALEKRQAPKQLPA
jgi:transposase